MISEEKQKPTPSGPFGAVLAAFNRYGVQYIVIGGQAVIAYGAVQFTRDADFWVNPTKTNLVRLRQALKELKTTLRFLPPLRLSYLKKGHGIHFRFKYEGREFLIDILGKVPRVSSFAAALKGAERIDWHGLPVPVLDISRLVATKKTDRERDYLAIQSLAEIIFKQVKRDETIRKGAMLWLIEESRMPRHLQIICREWRGGKEASLKSGRSAAILAAQGRRLSEIQKALDAEKEKLKEANREYWRPLVAELRQLRRRTRTRSGLYKKRRDRDKVLR